MLLLREERASPHFVASSPTFSSKPLSLPSPTPSSPHNLTCCPVVRKSQSLNFFKWLKLVSTWKPAFSVDEFGTGYSKDWFQLSPAKHTPLEAAQPLPRHKLNPAAQKHIINEDPVREAPSHPLIGRAPSTYSFDQGSAAWILMSVYPYKNYGC